MFSRLLHAVSTPFAVSLLAIGLVGCQQGEPHKVAVKPLVDSHWISTDSLMQLAIGSTAFAITQGGLTEAEPYRLLENNQLLIGTDTVELYLTSKGALSLEPTSRAVREAESIRLIYALRFTQLPH